MEIYSLIYSSKHSSAAAPAARRGNKRISFSFFASPIENGKDLRAASNKGIWWNLSLSAGDENNSEWASICFVNWMSQLFPKTQNVIMKRPFLHAGSPPRYFFLHYIKTIISDICSSTVTSSDLKHTLALPRTQPHSWSEERKNISKNIYRFSFGKWISCEINYPCLLSSCNRSGDEKHHLTERDLQTRATFLHSMLSAAALPPQTRHVRGSLTSTMAP